MSFRRMRLALIPAVLCSGCTGGTPPAEPAPRRAEAPAAAAERQTRTAPAAEPAMRAPEPAAALPRVSGATLRQALDRYLALEQARGVAAGHAIEHVDLNGDRRDEALVLMRSRRFCGSRGCLLLVFERTTAGYELHSRFLLGRTPMIAAEERTAGWRDLVAPMTSAGAGMRLVVLRHRNGTYPADTEQLAALPPTRNVSGRVLFSDD